MNLKKNILSCILLINSFFLFESAIAEFKVVNYGCDILFNYLIKSEIIEIQNLDGRTIKSNQNSQKNMNDVATYYDQKFNSYGDFKKNFLSRMQFRGLIFIDYLNKQFNIIKCYLPKPEGFDALLEEIPSWSGNKDYKKVHTIKPVPTSTSAADE